MRQLLLTKYIREKHQGHKASAGETLHFYQKAQGRKHSPTVQKNARYGFIIYIGPEKNCKILVDRENIQLSAKCNYCHFGTILEICRFVSLRMTMQGPQRIRQSSKHWWGCYLYQKLALIHLHLVNKTVFGIHLFQLIFLTLLLTYGNKIAIVTRTSYAPFFIHWERV